MSHSQPLRILIVEDEILIALELESLLQDAGHDVVGIAASSHDAIALGRRMRPDLAFVDIHLTDGPTGVDAARRLRELGATVLFMTANAKRIPEDRAGASGVIAKPYTERGVHQALAYVLGEGHALSYDVRAVRWSEPELSLPASLERVSAKWIRLCSRGTPLGDRVPSRDAILA